MLRYSSTLIFILLLLLSGLMITRADLTTRSRSEMRREPETYQARLADWRNHQIVYQVLVDRFAASPDLAKRAQLYQAPKRLLPWDTLPQKGEFVPAEQVYNHEIDFWGGDLRGVTEKLDYIRALGANVVYLNPIFLAYTNHKYDTIDYFTIDPQFGSEADLIRLCDEAHKRGMRVVLDGVFNHTGRRAAWFQEALKDPNSRYRNFYIFGNDIQNGYRGWLDLANLPELNYNNPAVGDRIYRAPDSVVQHYLAHTDGWRLDVAFDLGPKVLGELTAGAHRARADSYTVGEIYNYPAGWFPSLDGVMNMYFRRIILNLANGKLPGPQASEMIDELVDDAGIEPLLKSWNVLSNHDQPRLKNLFPDEKARVFAMTLQTALPGAPLVYYGEEIGLSGGEDPEQRGPMNWSLAERGSAPETKLFRSLLEIRNRQRALQVGDFLRIATSRLFAFTRLTDSVRDTVVVVANPTKETVTEVISPRDSWLMDVQPMRDLLSDYRTEINAGVITVTVPPMSVQLLVPVIKNDQNYTPYKRVD